MQVRLPSITDVKNKTVLVRVDYNVPIQKKAGKWVVTDDTRIRATLETLEFLLKHNAKIVLVTHLGRPDGKVDPELSLAPVARHLGKLIGQEVQLITGAWDETSQTCQNLAPGEVVMLENIRFWQEEEKNDSSFAKQLAKLGEVYINEAFSTAHRGHASNVGVAKYLPAFAGFALAKEVEALSALMHQPKRPFVMIVGGKKISDKVGAVVNLTKIADAVLLGGGTANNFLKADGFEIYHSVVEDKSPDSHKKSVNYVKVAEHLIEETKHDRILVDGYIPLPKIIYPIDVVAAVSPVSGKHSVIELVGDQHEQAQRENLMYLDIGPKTIQLYQEIIAEAGTIFWNGPMGVFEETAFAAGTREVAEAVAKSKATSVLGGGDTLAAVEQFGLSDQYDYLSAAGSAALEFLSGTELPGLQPLVIK